MSDWRWINIFFRDIVLASLLAWVNWKVEYRSWWAACLIGMLMVLISWHLRDFINEQKRLGE